VNVTEAAEIWERCKRQREQIDPQMEAAADVLKAYFQKTGKNKRGKIGYACTSYRSLDTKAVKEYLGEDVQKFEMRRTRETLSLLK
jgi:hypothetical protein